MIRAEVIALDTAGGSDARYTICGKDSVFLLSYRDGDELVIVARSTDPRRLSDWAFDHHALSVRHDYRCDLVERLIARGEM